jgi:hypothetical protein
VKNIIILNVVRPLQFRLDKYRPDLTKLDDLVSRLACESVHFTGILTCFVFLFRLIYLLQSNNKMQGQVSAFGRLISANGIASGLQTLKSCGGDYGLYFAVRCLGDSVRHSIDDIPLLIPPPLIICFESTYILWHQMQNPKCKKRGWKLFLQH